MRVLEHSEDRNTVTLFKRSFDKSTMCGWVDNCGIDDSCEDCPAYGKTKKLYYDDALKAWKDCENKINK